MRLAMLCLPLLLAACAQQAPRDDGLYRALGEEPGIVRIVEGMLLGSARDPRIARHFLDIDIERLREKLIEQLCFESGGPCVYTGDSMEESHKGLRLTPSDFNALVEHLQDAMEAEGVPTPAQNRLLARLAPMRGQVIDR
ncbi:MULTISPECIES: group I truncated hemoglobin [Pseudomonadaceae]|jgi:hemoglobin|uniref:Hemoglobin n=4 Tax=Pseudomonadales TaxID=72274 RepID=A0A1H2L4R0_9PSED|nr:MULTISPECIES: group 1 truncated hemoglobin [Pseudomonas]APU29265.1 globin [Pseudomonas alcaliphila JAB1]KQO43742.1 globin [Pseudomonas sp. Leaf83]MBG0839499.1 group 1 truncated hemoglobin [Pseudomonas toyotomiensis]MBP3061439.1 group 1 truncated hemoglobin [Pseudomonas chengduensis]MDH0701539.1 group 1 truncated hemoglobin [Pseudomonas toyotomiensis]